MFHYATRLHAAVRAKRTPALVGLDPRFPQLPEPIKSAAIARGATSMAETAAWAFEEFCRRIIDVVAPLVPAVKPQAAFFEELGPPGCMALSRVIRAARKAGLIVICDAKRGDIGSTAEAYARGYLAGADPDAAPWGADALTINPYLGRDTLEPFVATAHERGGGLYVLVRTSNPGAGTLQDLKSFDERESAVDPSRGGRTVYHRVAALVEELSLATSEGDYGAVGAVVGATYPRELAELRDVMPHTPLLVPGYGSQGAGAGDVAAAFRSDGLGALVNSSRGINFAHSMEPWKSRYAPHQWEQAVEAATRQMIADLAEHTPAGTLR